MKKNIFRSVILIIFMMTTSIAVNAQPKPPTDPTNNDQTNKLGAPISGAVMLVLGLGAAYGSSVLRRKEDEN